MYSLYRPELLRAWLRDTLLAPADIVVTVGEGRHFAAHRAVLASHSGYLKALLGPDPRLQALALPNLSPEAFGPLLHFMYSGYLDLCHDNIYSVLLAAHLLHMPRALDYCRAFLLQTQHQQEEARTSPPPPPPPPPPHVLPPVSPTPPTLVKPIPSRKLLPMLTTPCWPSYPPPPPPPPLPPYPPNFFPSHRSLFRAVHAPTPTDEGDTSPPPPVVVSTNATPEEPPSHHHLLLRAPSAVPSTSYITPPSSKAPPPQPPSLPSSSSPSLDVVQPPSASPGTKVVLDVACCDGPVRFHRVLNANYGLALDDILTPDNKETSSPTQQPQDLILDEDDAEEDEARHREERAAAAAKCSKEPDPVYKCLYCNHTFKSHYCYQKHTRRHINPVTFDLAKLADKLKAELVREVKLLDMNVQYYPCKTCGCKFPSYYFVHKHRRMCHPNEVEQEAKEGAAAAAAAAGSLSGGPAILGGPPSLPGSVKGVGSPFPVVATVTE